MKKVTVIIILLLFSICAWAQVEKYIPDPPNPPKLVNDGAGLLIPEQEQYLERKLVAYDDSTSNQILLFTTKSLHGYAPVDYAVALGRKWGVGGKQFNNGIIILVSTGGEGEKRSAFITTGYGLEGALPDITVKTILDAELIPNLRGEDYYGAFDKTINALIRAAAGEYKAPAGYRDRSRGGGISTGKIVIAVIILFVLLSMFGRGNRGGGYMSRRGYRGFWGPTIFPGGGGWGSGGGGGWSGGGGGGGGGFGGFGGGSFGGGGAGGDW